MATQNQGSAQALDTGPTTLPDGRPLRIAIDADCPRCGYGERFFEPARGVFGCSSLNPNPCGYESTERDA